MSCNKNEKIKRIHISILILSLLQNHCQCLNVIQIIDSIIVPVNSYIRLNNNNDANFASKEGNTYNQSLMVQITNQNENYVFDLFVFEVDDQLTSPDLECYLTSVNSK